MPIYYQTSDGERITDATIKRRYLEARKQKHAGQFGSLKCECRGRNCQGEATDNDHTIPQRRLKNDLHKAELIYNPGAFVSSCNNCHNEWESYKSGECLYHVNYEDRMEFYRIHDPDGAWIRDNLTPMFAPD